MLRGAAGDALLDTYHPERFPAFARNVQRSVENALNHLRIIEALGITARPSRPRSAAATCASSGRRAPRATRGASRWRGSIASQSMEFKEHNVEFGFRCASAAVVPDGSPEPVAIDDVRVYQPDTRPGSPLPHAWVERAGGARSAPPGRTAVGASR